VSSLDLARPSSPILTDHAGNDLQPSVGNIAINDAFMLEGAIYFLLKKHFRKEAYYVDLLELFHDVSEEGPGSGRDEFLANSRVVITVCSLFSIIDGLARCLGIFGTFASL
jgi:hypothetical protein